MTNTTFRQRAQVGVTDAVLRDYQKHRAIAGITLKVAVLASELKCGRDLIQLAGRTAVLPVRMD